MARQITTFHLIAAVWLAAVAGGALGGYIGNRQGYFGGFADGTELGSDLVLAQTMGSVSRSVPPSLTRATIQGFRRGLPCPATVGAAQAMAQASDPAQSLRGTQCSAILAALDRATGAAQ